MENCFFDYLGKFLLVESIRGCEEQDGVNGRAFRHQPQALLSATLAP
jgi:hypothetical protein